MTASVPSGAAPEQNSPSGIALKAYGVKLLRDGAATTVLQQSDVGLGGMQEAVRVRRKMEALA